MCKKRTCMGAKKDDIEVLFCGIGMGPSECEIDAKGCNCPACPVWESFNLKDNYFCGKQDAGNASEKTWMRRKSDGEEESFYTMITDIKDSAQTGESQVRSMGSKKKMPFTLDDLHFLPAQAAKVPLNGDEPVSSRTVIGPKAKRPLVLSAPIIFTGMSYGAVSRNVRLVLANVASKFNIGVNTGEDITIPEEFQIAPKQLIQQYSTGRFGTTEEMLKGAAATEIRFGQGAYPGWESLLPASKMTKEVADMMGLKEGEDALSPARHPDIREKKDIKSKVDWLRKVTGGTPVGAKIGCGNVEEDVESLAECGVDFIALDAFGGGTGATEYFVRDNVGIPIIAALPRAHRHLSDLGVRDGISLIAAGGLRTSADFAKCIALGADAVAIGTAALIAINCQQYRICHTGLCPTGVTTLDPILSKQLDVSEGTRKLSNFVKVSIHEIESFARIVGKDDVHNLDEGDLVALTRDVSKLTGVKWLDGRSH
jgi:methylamine---glutamate N-methyltransferase subunit C